MPEVSILLPFYNAESTLNRAVESIVHQTFSDWELILIDNGCTDKSPHLAKKWTQQDARINLTSCDDQGIAYALNKGLAIADAAYVARMDADDWSHPNRLEKQIGFLNEYPKIGAISCQTTFQSSFSKSEGYSHFVDWQNAILSPEEHYANRFKESPIAHPTVVFRKHLIDQHGGYSTAPIPEDYELWLRWMEAGVLFAKITEKLLTWSDQSSRLSRKHPNYAEASFFKVKGQYLSRWMEKYVSSDKKVVACGTSKECRQRATWLMEQGVRVDFLTDIVHRKPQSFEFLAYREIKSPERHFVLNLIRKRGIGEKIERYFTNIGFTNGQNFFSLA